MSGEPNEVEGAAQEGILRSAQRQSTGPSNTRITSATRKEHPIIMSGDNPKLILEDRKTQTRRLCKALIKDGQEAPKIEAGFWGKFKDELVWTRCPYGVAGDRLWVRETFRRQRDCPTMYRSTTSMTDSAWRWTPSIHMPRKFSRITLEILMVRVERLQDITEEDAKAEGITLREDSLLYEPSGPHGTLTAIQAYANLWDSLHGKGGWDKNPWVWVLEFQRAPTPESTQSTRPEV